MSIEPGKQVDSSRGGIPPPNCQHDTRWHYTSVATSQVPMCPKNELPIRSLTVTSRRVVNRVSSDVCTVVDSHR